MTKKRRLEDKVGPTESIIPPGTKFKGTIIGSEGVRISGQFEGKIKSERLVRIEKEGRIDGTINSPYVIIEGKLNGNIESAEQVELRIEGRVIGNINTAKIAIAEGSSLQGEVRVSRKEDKPIIFAEKRKVGDEQDNQDESL